MPYIPFTEEQKEAANLVNLEDFLRMRGEKLERVGGESKLIYYDGNGKHDSIMISGSKWFDHKNQTGGGAVKFMMYFYDMDFPTAVQTLLGQTFEPISYVKTVPKSAEKKKEFKLPIANKNMRRVFAYLIKQRFIDPKIIEHFAKNHTLYEDKEHHNAVFVGLDEKGVPRQAHKRSTSTMGKSFRLTCEGSDTRYSFAHFGTSEKLFVFEAPIDMLSFLTLYPQNWQENSYIAMNGVYENSVLTALKNHPNLSEVILCVDNDEGGIEAVDRLTDILREKGIKNIRRFAPKLKDWNEILKAKNGVEFLSAVPHKRKDLYQKTAENLEHLQCRPDKLFYQISASFKNRQYKFLAEYALAASAFFIDKNAEKENFSRLKSRLKYGYKPYTDKGKKTQKERNLKDCVGKILQDLKRPARTKEQSIETAKMLFELADLSLRLEVENTLENQEISQSEDEDFLENQSEVLSQTFA